MKVLGLKLKFIGLKFAFGVPIDGKGALSATK
jgi:hypothetical protein